MLGDLISEHFLCTSHVGKTPQTLQSKCFCTSLKTNVSRFSQLLFSIWLMIFRFEKLYHTKTPVLN